ncbi:hypothetical protein L6452_01090 [Arctium lappa]|uniref:Uncharacterized protein n=1 Tax=Arctium lappa TaxID=4217 RepID=A0ACB9FF67_ARCLA|nr:hypothetical protein L6452_01090 [Arctium lappa]
MYGCLEEPTGQWMEALRKSTGAVVGSLEETDGVGGDGENEKELLDFYLGKLFVAKDDRLPAEQVNM